MLSHHYPGVQIFNIKKNVDKESWGEVIEGGFHLAMILLTISS